MTNNDTLASRIVERRAKLGWSQDELARQSGIAPAQISRYESGKNKPRANIIEKLATALCVPFSWLAYGDESEMLSDVPDHMTDIYLNLPEEVMLMARENSKLRNMEVNDYILWLLRKDMDEKIRNK